MLYKLRYAVYFVTDKSLHDYDSTDSSTVRLVVGVVVFFVVVAIIVVVVVVVLRRRRSRSARFYTRLLLTNFHLCCLVKF